MQKIMLTRWSFLAIASVTLGTVLLQNPNLKGEGAVQVGSEEKAAEAPNSTPAITAPASSTPAKPKKYKGSLHSVDTVMFFANHGTEKFEGAWKKTAVYEAYKLSGLEEMSEKMEAFVKKKGIGAKEQEIFKDVEKTIGANGFSFSLAVPKENGPPIPRGTLVFPNAGKFIPMLVPLLDKLSEEVRLDIQTMDKSGRTVTSFIVPNSPGIEIAMWAEGNHAVFSAGLGAANYVIAIANGSAKSLADNEFHKKFDATKSDFTANNEFWFDFASLRSVYSNFPVPGPANVTVGDVLKLIDFDKIEAIHGRSGIKDRAMYSQATLVCPNPKPFWLSPGENKSFTLADLPPFPTTTSFFGVENYSIASLYKSLYSKVQEAGELADEPLTREWDRFTMKFKEELGVELYDDLLATLGDTVSFYEEPNGGLFRFGMAIKLSDSQKFLQSLTTISTFLEGKNGPVSIRMSEKHGRPMAILKGGDDGFKVPVLNMGIDKDWLVVGLTPQVATSFFLRQDGKLDKWKPNAEDQAALKSMPKEFSSLSFLDVRKTYHGLCALLHSFAPMIEVGMEMANIVEPGEKMPIGPEDLAPAELVVKPLFNNMAFSTTDENKIVWTSRSSAQGFMIGGSDTGLVIAGVAVGTALLLPAIQKARQAARRTVSMNNIKQQALASHNYADTYKHFPAGTAPMKNGKVNTALKTEERLSWMTSVLPFIEQQNIYRNLNFDEKWNSKNNLPFASMRIEAFTNPGLGDPPMKGTEGSPTHYVGIAGLGADSATDNPKDKTKTGIFSNNGKTRYQDIKDGTSNTMMFMEVNKKIGPWAKGGNSTVRAFTKKPYINGPDGFGGATPNGVNAGMADGSVRFISKNVDPKILEALMTKNGGEIINYDDF